MCFNLLGLEEPSNSKAAADIRFIEQRNKNKMAKSLLGGNQGNLGYHQSSGHSNLIDAIFWSNIHTHWKKKNS